MTERELREQWDELAAAASRLNTFCRTIDALRGNDNSDVPAEINCMERAAWCEAHHIGEVVSSLPSPFADPS
jgi:hypothetical protein